jgi:hypothetical protein
MAYRKRRSTRSYGGSSRSYRPARRRRTSSAGSRRRTGGGQTIRLMLQQPQAPAAPRPPFGTFMPSALFGPFAAAMMGHTQAGMVQPGQGLQGWGGMGFPSQPGARMIIDPTSPTVDLPENSGSETGAAEAVAPGRKK